MPPEAYVFIGAIEGGLVEGSEIVGDGHDAVVEVKADEAVAVVHRVGVRSLRRRCRCRWRRRGGRRDCCLWD